MKKRIPLFSVVILAAVLASCEGYKRIHQQNDTSQLAPLERDSIRFIGRADTTILLHAPSRITRKIRKNQAGDLLFAAYTDIIQYDGASFALLPKSSDFDSFDAFDAIEDNQGNIWIASTHFGVYVYDPSSERTTQFTTENGLAHNRAMCLMKDKTGAIWIGTEEGISIFKGNPEENTPIEFQNYSTQEGLTNDNINTILEDRTGRIWVGTRGVLFVDDSTPPPKSNAISFREFTDQYGRSFENVWSILEDRTGSIWLAGQHGLWKINGNNPTLISEMSATGLLEDSKGNIWFTHSTNASQEAGLSCIEMSSTLNWEPEPTLVFIDNGMFFGLSEDMEGNIWVGTLQGVLRYDGNSILYFKEK